MAEKKDSEDCEDSNDVYTNQDLFRSNFPKIIYDKTASRPSSYSSLHNPLDRIVDSSFGIINDLSSFLSLRGLKRESVFLGRMADKSFRLYSAREQDFQAKVEDYILDVIRCLKLKLGQLLTLHRQASLSLEMKPDIWIVKEASGRPITVIDVKPPGEYTLLNGTICGQLYDYLMKLRSSYGQCEVFGIITNLKEWRFGWFPDSDDFARSVSIQPEVIGDSYLRSFSLSITERVLHMSRVYELSSKELVPTICSCLLKSLHSSYRPVPLFSTTRVYQTLSCDSFFWESYPSVPTTYKDIQFSIPTKQTIYFKVLRFFHPGADGRVALVCTNSFHLSVIKYFLYDDTCHTKRLTEESYWQNVYGQPVYTQRLFRKEVLLMPFVFHCRVDEERKEVWFHFDLSYWGCEDKAFGESHPILSEWCSLFDAYYRSKELTPKRVAERAIDLLASKRLVHRDLEWRHVSLLPIIDQESTTIRDMMPVFIDLSTVTPVETEDIAKEEMLQSLEKISHGYRC